MQFSLSGLVLASSLVLGSSFKAPTVTLDELLNPSWAVTSHIERAVSEVGFFAVTLGDEQQQQKSDALKELVTCIRSGDAAKHVQVMEMGDQTVRSTLATSTNQTVAQQFDATLQTECPTFVTLSDSVRTTTAAVGAAYAKVLDKLEQRDPRVTVGPFGEAVARSENLEHFHVYWRRDERKDGKPTLRMHTDLGMFIVMTPPQYFHFSGSIPSQRHIDTGFQVKLPNGEIVTPEFPAGSVVVMNGEGCADWVQSKTARSLYVPPHQVVLPAGTQGMGRAWYGRMYLPPRNSPKQDEERQPVTFNQYWTDASAAVIRAPTGEASLGHRMLVDQGNCSAGNLYCWMGCMNASVVNGCPANNIQCTDNNGTVWFPGMSHCMKCKLYCNATTNTTNATNTTTTPVTKNAGLASAPHFALLALLLAIGAVLHL